MEKLLGEQLKILNLPDNRHNYIILGAAGTGKSLIASHRVQKLSQKYPDKTIVFITFNRYISQKLNRDFPENKNVTVKTYHKFARDLIKDYYKQFREFKDKGYELFNYVGNNEAKDNIIKAIEDTKRRKPQANFWKKSQLNDEFIYAEIIWLEDNHIESAEEYLKAHRVGRGTTRINRDDRLILYEIFEQYEKLLTKDHQHLYDFNLISWYILKCKKFLPQIDYLIVDEFQNLSKADLQSLVQLTDPRPGHIMLFGDISQQLFGRRFSWRQLGIDNSRKEILTKVYRNTQQISNLARSILYTNPIDEGEETEDVVAAGMCERTGSKPLLVNTPDDDHLVNYLIEASRKLSKNGSTLVILNNGKKRKEIIEKLKNQNVNVHYSNNYHDYDPSKQLFICSVNQLVGLEFDTVIYADVDINVNSVNKDSFRNFIHSIYIGITRAKKQLIMLYQSPDKIAYLNKSKQYFTHQTDN